MLSIPPATITSWKEKCDPLLEIIRYTLHTFHSFSYHHILKQKVWTHPHPPVPTPHSSSDHHILKSKVWTLTWNSTVHWAYFLFFLLRPHPEKQSIYIYVQHTRLSLTQTDQHQTPTVIWWSCMQLMVCKHLSVHLQQHFQELGFLCFYVGIKKKKKKKESGMCRTIS